MFPFTKLGPFDRGECKAVGYAVLFSSVFIITLAAVQPRPAKKRHASHDLSMPTPVTPSTLLQSEPTPVDYNEPYRDVPENFKNIDFKNRSYGVYAFQNGVKVELSLYESGLKLPDALGWFALEDVFYRDLTGDGRPEAIVRLSHVQCGGPCDGGSDLFYIYTERGGKLKKVWEYETGSYAYGCGLKSLTIGEKQLVLEMFGHCPKPSMESPGDVKFVAEDLTFLLFEFDGNRFKTKTIEYIPEPARDVKNYRPDIRIY